MLAVPPSAAAEQACATPSSPGRGIRCRQIGATDRDAIIDLLCEGFPRTKRPYWEAAFCRLDANHPPDNLPQYGFMLEAAGAAVGVLLLISAALPAAGEPLLRSNLSSWYVRPAFRIYASVLVSRVMGLPTGSLVNVSPAPSTWPIIETQGFHRFSSGAFVGVPALSWQGAAARVQLPDAVDGLAITAGERQVLQDHARHGCLSFCAMADGRGHPFVFRRRMFNRFPLPGAHLIYCRDIGDLSRFAGPVGRFLARRGIGWIIASTDERVGKLAGMLLPDRLPMYAAGAAPPRAGDLAYTEAALFGF